MDLPTKRFVKILDEYEIPTIDLTGPFRKAMDSGADLYDGHFNRAGHDMAAEIVCQRLYNMVPLFSPTKRPHG
jgi:hypothetical protein